jgi:choloylglycine hydrolase
MLKCLVVLIASFLLIFPAMAQACTGITLKGADGTIVHSRTLEWGEFNLFPRLDIVPEGYVFESEKMPDGKAGMKWKTRYGFVGISMLHKNAYVDGLNEKGLAAGMFYLPGFSKYPAYQSDKASSSMAPTDLLSYVLSCCSSVADAREALTKIHVAPVIEPSLGFTAPMHLMITDRTGTSIVVEFIDNKMVVFDAPLGVITNSPNYDWHMTNLRNYINMSAVSLPTKKLSGDDFAPLGYGTGMLGLPGDFTPPSRFVRAVAFSQAARKTTGGYDTVRESFRILDNFDVPIDATEVAENAKRGGKKMFSSTQITTAADTKNEVFYYHTQFNRRVRKVELKKIPFGKMGTKMVTRPADESRNDDIKDVTPKL